MAETRQPGVDSQFARTHSAQSQTTTPANDLTSHFNAPSPGDPNSRLAPQTNGPEQSRHATRPPLEAPQMGQLNRPLGATPQAPPPTAQPTAQPPGAPQIAGPSGLNRTGLIHPQADQPRPQHAPPADASATPSGLPARDPAPQAQSVPWPPAAAGAPQEETPSGLPQRPEPDRGTSQG